jgi:hypothetical protein
MIPPLLEFEKSDSKNTFYPRLFRAAERRQRLTGGLFCRQ